MFYSFVASNITISNHQMSSMKGNVLRKTLSHPIPDMAINSGSSMKILCSDCRCESCNSIVNMTNILRAHFLPFFSPKKYKAKLKVQKSFAYNFRMKNLLIRCWWNWHLFDQSKVTFGVTGCPGGLPPPRSMPWKSFSAIFFWSFCN